jgi:hypothetical protein
MKKRNIRKFKNQELIAVSKAAFQCQRCYIKRWQCVENNESPEVELKTQQG